MDEKLCEYRYSSDFEVTDQMKDDFYKYGYIVIRKKMVDYGDFTLHTTEKTSYQYVPNLLDDRELKNILQTVDGTDAILKHVYGAVDENGKLFNKVNWGQPGNDVTGMVARSEKVAGTCEKLLGGEVYHYHTKLMMKPAKHGGPKLWHQDYGYWYYNGCLFPDMMTVFVPLDPCKKQNGCLQILRGSNNCGRIDHLPNGREIDADLKRVDVIMKQCPLEYIEMNPGDAIYFHCNLLHTSVANCSDTRRWALAMAFNKATNNPTIEHHHPRYTPLHKVPNSAIKECRNYTDMTGKDFMNPRQMDKTIELNVNKQ